MKYLEILCYAIAHIDSKREELVEKRKLFDNNADMQGMVDVMIADLDAKKNNLKVLYQIECGSEYAE
jgi:hypothetical protein